MCFITALDSYSDAKHSESNKERGKITINFLGLGFKESIREFEMHSLQEFASS